MNEIIEINEISEDKNEIFDIYKVKKLIGEENMISIYDKYVEMKDKMIEKGQDRKDFKPEKEYMKSLKNGVQYLICLSCKNLKIEETPKGIALKCPTKYFDNLKEAYYWRENKLKENNE